jgi:cytochrome P450
MTADVVPGPLDGASPPKSAASWDIYAIALEDDPHVRWRALREASPVLDTGGGVFFITRWDLVDACLRDPRHGAGSGVAASFGAETGLVFDVMRSWLMSLDGPPQQRARDLVRREFTPRKIEGLRPLASEIAERLIAPIEAQAGSETVDLIPSLAFALPSEVIRVLFGIPKDEWQAGIEDVIRNVGQQVVQGDVSGPTDGIAMIEGLAREFDGRLRSGRVPEGLLSQLCVPDRELGALSTLEVVANAVLLVTAAIDTTSGLIGNAVACLLERPELLARVRREPERIAAVVEETLRFEPPALSCSRSAGYDHELEGVSIPAGSQLLLGLGAANRDPRRYADPDRFAIDRDHTGLVSFGGGRHFCLGAALARMEAQIAVERLLVRSDVDWALAGGARWQKRNPTIRAHESLPLVRSGRRVPAGPRPSDPAPRPSR